MLVEAYVLGLKPGEFWLTTPREFACMQRGFQKVQEMQMQQIAWHAANIMNASGNLKHPVGVDELLGKKKGGK